jgi:2'-5' RNA ligase
MELLCRRLDSFTASQRQSEYSLSGFGNFGEGVIYIDVLPSPEMSLSVTALLETLRKVDGLTFDEFDTARDFHATVAMRALKPFDFKKIWNYLESGPQPDFKMKFDNIAVFKKPSDSDDVWVVEHIWELAP